jgi:hypothetical protein
MIAVLIRARIQLVLVLLYASLMWLTALASFLVDFESSFKQSLGHIPSPLFHSDYRTPFFQLHYPCLFKEIPITLPAIVGPNFA